MGNHTKQTQKTKAKIKKALMELVNEKDFELITNNDICKKACIHRTTFKSYYGSIHDVLKDIKDDMFCEFDKISDSKSIRCKYIDLLNLIKYYHKYFIVYFSDDIPVLMPARIEEALHFACENHIIPNICDDIDKEYAVTMMRNGSKAAIHHWLKTGCNESPEELADYIIKFFGIPENIEF